MPFAQVFLALPALNGGQIEIVLAMGAHIDVVPLAEGDNLDIDKRTILINSILDKDVFSVYHSLVFLQDLAKERVYLAIVRTIGA